MPSLVGDYNCVVRKQDVEGGCQENNSGNFSMHLKDLLNRFDYIDGYLLSDLNRVGFTWRRRGRRSSRLDRVYLPPDRAGDILSPAEHHSHLSDHDALVFNLNCSGFAQDSSKTKINSNYWKMNKSILLDINFNVNFLSIMEEINLK